MSSRKPGDHPRVEQSSTPHKDAKPRGPLLPEDLTEIVAKQRSGKVTSTYKMRTGEDPDDPTNGRGEALILQEQATGELPKQGRKLLQVATLITPMQEAFITYYVATRDKKEAAIQAGYAEVSAEATGRKLLNSTLYPLVANKIKTLFQKQQEIAVMDGAAILRYIHYVLQFCPADWFLPGRDGGWVVDMDDYRVLPQEVRQLIEEMETRTTQLPDGTQTNTLWVRFVSKQQALVLASRYQLGDLNADKTPIVQIDWGKLFGRKPLVITQSTTTTTSTVTLGQDTALSGALPQAPSTSSRHPILPPEVQVGDRGDYDDVDPVERRILQLEAANTTADEDATLLAHSTVDDVIPVPPPPKVKKDRTFPFNKK